MAAYKQTNSERTQQQKAKRKHNLSQGVPKNFEQSAKLLMPNDSNGGVGQMGGNSGQGNQTGVIQKLQQTFGSTNEMSKRSYDQSYPMDKKGSKQTKKGHSSSIGPNQFESARYNSISALNKTSGNGQNLISGQTG